VKGNLPLDVIVEPSDRSPPLTAFSPLIFDVAVAACLALGSWSSSYFHLTIMNGVHYLALTY
jgi:hypothetical protein